MHTTAELDPATGLFGHRFPGLHKVPCAASLFDVNSPSRKSVSNLLEKSSGAKESAASQYPHWKV
jgi:hypothetical protein